ncbi:hypothetical protein FRAAL3668 [Frankia alni ACN14a]|uniref:Uncharacterized protein n=1 Tax=Frankia alni (strain DSM 45986 / CECT 9034 / ACN14a) TaxID=326424 RepID=Q0RJK1_FRAAA|nr:hypothetical protein FRAAL3668 [Frankia alni ACN14a]
MQTRKQTQDQGVERAFDTMGVRVLCWWLWSRTYGGASTSPGTASIATSPTSSAGG